MDMRFQNDAAALAPAFIKAMRQALRDDYDTAREAYGVESDRLASDIDGLSSEQISRLSHGRSAVAIFKIDEDELMEAIIQVKNDVVPLVEPERWERSMGMVASGVLSTLRTELERNRARAMTCYDISSDELCDAVMSLSSIEMMQIGENMRASSSFLKIDASIHLQRAVAGLKGEITNFELDFIRIMHFAGMLTKKKTAA